MALLVPSSLRHAAGSSVGQSAHTSRGAMIRSALNPVRYTARASTPRRAASMLPSVHLLRRRGAYAEHVQLASCSLHLGMSTTSTKQPLSPKTAIAASSRSGPVSLVAAAGPTAGGGAVPTVARVSPSASLSTATAASTSNLNASDKSDESQRITLIGAGVNGGAGVLKGVAGLAAGSPSLIADAAHSFSDVLSDAVTLWALAQSKRPACELHPYGRGKYEAVGASVTAAMIISTGLGVGYHSLCGLIEVMGTTGAAHTPTASMGGAAAAAIAGLLAKELLYRETLRIGTLSRSPALLANAWHHRTDAFSSVVALLGICGSICGYHALDSVGGVVVAVMVTRAGIQMGAENLAQLTDSQVEGDVLSQVDALAADDVDVLGITSLRCRRLGPYIHVEMRLQIATKAKLRVLKGMSEVADVTVSLDAETPVETNFGPDIVVGRQVNPSPDELMRSPVEIEKDVRAAIATAAHLGRKTRKTDDAKIDTKNDAKNDGDVDSAIESDVENALDSGVGGSKEDVTGGRLWGLSHSLVHWRSRGACSGAIVEASLVLDPETRLREAHLMAAAIRRAVLRQVPDVRDVDLHLELFDGAAGEQGYRAIDELPHNFRLPSEADAKARLEEARARRARPRRQAEQQ